MSCFLVQTGVQLLLVNGFDDTAGIAHCQCIVGNVARDHRTGFDGDIVANRYPRQYRHVATYPHIIPYADGACILHACIM